MTSLNQVAEDYLTVRRALGYKLESAGILLSQFIAYLERVGADTVTVEHAVLWSTLPADASPAYWQRRLVVARGFARYLQTIDPTAEVPPTDVLPSVIGRRPAPYIYSDEDISALLAAAGKWRSRLGAPTLQTVIGLLSVTGMRIGEAIRLDRDDLDLTYGRLTIRSSKFGKSRQLPLHPSTVDAMGDYLRLRDRLSPHTNTPALLLSTTGQRLARHYVEWQFAQLRSRVGLTARPGSKPPRLHDLRHTFAVRTMLDSYQAGGDPRAQLAQLSTYLGHANPGASYWYLSATPELLGVAAQRLENSLAENVR